MLPKISIIVPIYKVEPYLEKCVESILKQTFTDFELILVDDGSPDHCPEICDEYAKKDNRIRVIHKKNGGLSSARNAGIDVAQGAYLSFIDGDDWIAPDMYLKMVSLMEEHGGDIAVCEYDEVDESVTELVPLGRMTREIKIFNNIEALQQIYGELNVKMVIACNKLYKKGLFDEIRYPEGKIHEDEFVIHELLFKANKVIYTNETFYAYVQRTGSIMRQSYNLAHLDAIEAFLNRIYFFEEKGLEELKTLTEQRTLQAMIDAYMDVKIYCKNRKDILQTLKTQCMLLYKEANKRRDFDVKMKIKMKAFYFIPSLFRFIRKIKQKIRKISFNGERSA